MYDIQFVKATIQDIEAEIIMCTCGKKAQTVVLATDSFVALCNECMYGEKND